MKVVTRDENAHVAFLKKALGQKAVKSPVFEFGEANTNAEKFMATSYVLENTGRSCLPRAGSEHQIGAAYLAAAGSILTIEARHAAVIGLLNEAGRQRHRSRLVRSTFLTRRARSSTAVEGTKFIK